MMAQTGSRGHAHVMSALVCGRGVPTGRVADGVNDLGLAYYSDLVRSRVRRGDDMSKCLGNVVNWMGWL